MADGACSDCGKPLGSTVTVGPEGAQLHPSCVDAYVRREVGPDGVVLMYQGEPPAEEASGSSRFIHLTDCCFEALGEAADLVRSRARHHVQRIIPTVVPLAHDQDDRYDNDHDGEQEPAEDSAHGEGLAWM